MLDFIKKLTKVLPGISACQFGCIFIKKKKKKKRGQKLHLKLFSVKYKVRLSTSYGLLTDIDANQEGENDESFHVILAP